MRLRSLLATAGTASYLAFAAPAFAAHVQDCIGPQNAGSSTSDACTSGTATTAGNAIVGIVVVSNTVGNPVTSITDNQSNTYTLLDAVGPLSGTQDYSKSFVSYNTTGGVTTVTAHYTGGTTSFGQVIWSEYSGVSATDAHTAQAQTVDTATNAVMSGNMTPTVTGDTVWGASYGENGAAEENVGTNLSFTQRVAVAVGNGWGQTIEDAMSNSTTAVSADFTATTADIFATYGLLMKPAATPVSIACNPVSPSWPDNTAANTQLCAYTVTTSDLSTFAGTVSVVPSFFNLTSAVANGYLRNTSLFNSGDDGIQKATITATEHGVTISQVINVNVTPAAQSGTPFAMSWKNIDPGISSTEGLGIATMPRTGTINEIAFRVATPTPAGVPALLDLYRAPAGAACNPTSSPLKIHLGDLDASKSSDLLQTITGTNLQNTSVSIGDTLCLVTQQPFPTTGAASVTVTVNLP